MPAERLPEDTGTGAGNCIATPHRMQEARHSTRHDRADVEFGVIAHVSDCLSAHSRRRINSACERGTKPSFFTRERNLYPVRQYQ
jgi:hypothetical protein